MELEEQGLTVDNLKQFLHVARKFGSVSKVIEAIEAFSNLSAIEQEINKLDSQKEVSGRQLASLRAETRALEEKRGQIQGTLETYNKLKEKSLDDDVIRKIMQSSVKYGGVKSILEAINAHENLATIKSQSDEIERKKSNEEARLNKANADHAHLQSLLGMLNTLLYDLKSTIPAIEDIYEAAKKYGRPLEVIKALAKYDELKNLEKGVDYLSKRKTELESKINVLEGKLEGQATAIKESVNGLLKPISSEVGQALSNAVENMASAFQQQIDMVKKHSEEYGKRLGQSTAFEEELKLARLISATIKYPTEAARELPIDHAILLINSV